MEFNIIKCSDFNFSVFSGYWTALEFRGEDVETWAPTLTASWTGARTSWLIPTSCWRLGLSSGPAPSLWGWWLTAGCWRDCWPSWSIPHSHSMTPWPSRGACSLTGSLGLSAPQRHTRSFWNTAQDHTCSHVLTPPPPLWTGTQLELWNVQKCLILFIAVFYYYIVVTCSNMFLCGLVVEAKISPLGIHKVPTNL